MSSPEEEPEEVVQMKERKGGGSVVPVAHSSVEQDIRLGFYRKVYGILFVQLAFTALVCAVAMKAVATDKVGVLLFL
jgi:FtsH-binding integral membrane protein